MEINDFPVEGMTKRFGYENLTKTRKRLLWRTKQAAKNKQYKYTWIMNGRIYVRQDTEYGAIIATYDNDLGKL